MSNSTKVKIWYWLLAFMSVAIILALVFIYINANSVEYSEKIYKDKITKPALVLDQKSWIKLFSEKKDFDTILPTTEVSIKLEKVDGYFKNRERYTLVLQNLDDYKFFCAKQVIESYNRPFSFLKKDNEVSFILLLESKKIKDNILNELKNYDINVDREF